MDDTSVKIMALGVSSNISSDERSACPKHVIQLASFLSTFSQTHQIHKKK